MYHTYTHTPTNNGNKKMLAVSSCVTMIMKHAPAMRNCTNTWNIFIRRNSLNFFFEKKIAKMKRRTKQTVKIDSNLTRMQSVEWCPASELFFVDCVVFVVQQLAPSHSGCYDIHLVPDLIKIPFPNRSYPIRAIPYRPHVLLIRRLTNVWCWWMDGWAWFATNSNVSLPSTINQKPQRARANDGDMDIINITSTRNWILGVRFFVVVILR